MQKNILIKLKLNVTSNDIQKLKQEEDLMKFNEIKQQDKPKLKHENYQVISGAVEEMTDEEILTEITKNDIHINTQQEATDIITIQTLLEKIAQNDTNNYVRQTATEKLTNQTLLEKIAQNETHGEIRK